MTRRLLLTLTLLPALMVGVNVGRTAADDKSAGIEFFEKKIRPVLVDSCLKCHTTGKKPKADLTLDSRAGMLKGTENGPAIVPGDPAKSRLIHAIGYADKDLRMPPRGKLPAEQIDDFAHWIKIGAPWPDEAAVKPIVAKEFNLKERAKHWSLQAVTARPLPAVKNKQWPTANIDHFILADLETSGLAPAAPADRRTLLRRVTFDLIGLPPTPAEIDAFLADKTPDAFAKVVDRLLASPHYGERWGRHWLDLVRYADTYGHEFDFEIPDAWRYRDYVIRAFNDDVPFNQFIMEHIAGDLLPKPRRHPAEKFNESILGTGFFFLHEAKHSPVDVRADQMDRIDNQIDVLTKTFLATTVSCARCHDHKFDAVTQKDYYALVGHLQSARYQHAFIDDPEPLRAKIKELAHLHDQARPLARAATAQALSKQVEQFATAVTLPGAPWQKALAKIDRNNPQHPLHPLLALLTTPADQFPAKREALAKYLQVQQMAAAKSDAVTLADFTKGHYQDWFVSGEAFGAAPLVQPVDLIQNNPARPLRGMVGPFVAHSGAVSHQLKGVLRSKTFTIESDKIFIRVAGNQAKINLILDGLQLIRDPIYGGLTQGVNKLDEPRWLTFNVAMWRGHRAYLEIIDDGPGWIAVEAVATGNAGPPQPGASALALHLIDDEALKTPQQLSQKYQNVLLNLLDQWAANKPLAPETGDRAHLLDWLVRSDLAANVNPDARLAPLLRDIQDHEAKLPASRRALALVEGSGVDERLFVRGNHRTLGEEVPRRFLEVLDGKLGGDVTNRRLRLAQQIAHPQNPLTARVLVNRLWKHHFGEGIVRTPDDFGVLGQAPTHPALLDYLAAEFVKQGWSIKKMHRQLLLSSTYQMASKADPQAAKIDPENKLLHRMPVRRLEAEAIRDALLAVSGRLDKTQFGPGVMPHLTPFMLGRGRPGASGPLDGNGRRSIYLNVRRNFLNPLFLAFDYPVPFSTMGRRGVSNVPAQALTLLNNPFVLQQAEVWGKRTLTEPKAADKQRVERLYVEAFARPPSAAELADTLAFLEEQGRLYGKAGDPRAWADLCHVLVNVKEFIYIQ